VVWGAVLDRTDQLMLLAVIAQGLGWKEGRNYQPPSEELAEYLAGLDGTEDEGDRRRRIELFAAETGGEVSGGAAGG
jgi:hypothetical protein